MSDGFEFQLPPNPAIASALADPAVTQHVSGRITAWLEARGYVVSDGLAVLADGSVLLNADRDPAAEWSTFDPTAKTVVEIEDDARRLDALAVLDRLDQGVATTAELRRAVMFALRRALRDGPP